MLHKNIVCYALFSFALLILGCAMPAAAQELDCTFTYTSAAGKPSLKFCVSASGTLIDVEVPIGDEFIAQGNISTAGKLEGWEGYGLCNESPAQAYTNYINDYSVSSNWNPPTVLSQTATSIKIAHSTSDGVWTLTQTFLADTVTPGVKIMMALHNNTSTARVAYLFRQAKVAKFPQVSSTHSRVFGWVQSTPVENFGDGVIIENVGTPQFGFMNAYVYETGHVFPPNPCDFANGASNSVLLNGDSLGDVGIAYVDSIGPHKTKTATIRYRSMN
jgi:hypothetical protein